MKVLIVVRTGTMEVRSSEDRKGMTVPRYSYPCTSGRSGQWGDTFLFTSRVGSSTTLVGFQCIVLSLF